MQTRGKNEKSKGKRGKSRRAEVQITKGILTSPKSSIRGKISCRKKKTNARGVHQNREAIATTKRKIAAKNRRQEHRLDTRKRLGTFSGGRVLKDEV